MYRRDSIGYIVWVKTMVSSEHSFITTWTFIQLLRGRSVLTFVF